MMRTAHNNSSTQQYLTAEVEADGDLFALGEAHETLAQQRETERHERQRRVFAVVSFVSFRFVACL